MSDLNALIIYTYIKCIADLLININISIDAFQIYFIQSKFVGDAAAVAALGAVVAAVASARYSHLLHFYR